MKIHVEGMGWFGSVVAWHLDRAGHDFTWHDSDSVRVAWKASTGIVYPAGDSRSAADHLSWLSWQEEPWWSPAFPLDPHKAAARCAYWFNHKRPPHAGRSKIAADLGSMRMTMLPAVQVNVPMVVEATRRHFALRRVTRSPVEPHLLIVAHGYHPLRNAGVVWGWHNRVQLGYSDLVAYHSRRFGGAPSFYGRIGRFGMAYAYALPGETDDVWLAGSSLIVQKWAKPLDAMKHFGTWAGKFREAFPEVEIKGMSRPMQGWRPRGRPDDSGHVERSEPDMITVPPLWHSGIRWAPSVAREVMEMVG